jgi:hypothetical protein
VVEGKRGSESAAVTLHEARIRAQSGMAQNGTSSITVQKDAVSIGLCMTRAQRRISTDEKSIIYPRLMIPGFGLASCTAFLHLEVLGLASTNWTAIDSLISG